LVILVSCAAFFYGLGSYGLWDPDEGRSGLIAAEMLRSGNWITLTRHGEPYYDKPALYFWLVAVGFKLLGLGELAVRLPSALAATLTVTAVFFWGFAFGGSRLGLWAGLVLASSMEFVALGRFGNTDMLFTFFLTSALLYFLWWKEHACGKGWVWPFYLFLACACLTKGPAGLLLPSLIIGISLGLRNRWEIARQINLAQGAVVLGLVAGSWYLLAALRDPEYIKTFLWSHNILRFFASRDGIDHP